jgi:urease accessory protein UreE
MQSLTLPFYQRIMLWNVIGNHAAPNLKEASIGLRVIEKLRLTDEEQTDTEFTTSGQQYGWKLPDPDYGTKTVDLETDEAKALAAAIEAAPTRVIDAVWLQPIVDKLTASPNGAKPS